MPDYTIVNGELYHYGVKGMRWGHRKAQARYAKKLGRAARKMGAAEYEREQGLAAYNKHNNNAKVFDKAAKSYEAKGQYFKAEASRKAANALRARGENVKASHDRMADAYMKRAAKLQEKANTYATKKRVDTGKKLVDSIISENKQKGYDRRSRWVDMNKEYETRKKLGDDGYEVYNKIRGKS